MNIYEAIKFHNHQIDALQELAKALIKTYKDIEETDVDTTFGKVCDSLVPMAIMLCCEANHTDPNKKWCTDSIWRVVPSKDKDKDRDRDRDRDREVDIDEI